MKKDMLIKLTKSFEEFVGEITHFNVKKKNLKGKNQISKEDEKNNRDVRRVLAKSNIYPVKNQDGEAILNSGKLPK